MKSSICYSFILTLALFTSVIYLNAQTTITSFPYSESFESGAGAWTGITTSDVCLQSIDWNRKSGNTSSINTGPTSAQQGSYYIYTEASSPCSTSNKNKYATSPILNLAGKSSASISFQYHRYGEYLGTLFLQVSTNGGSTWSTIWTGNSTSNNAWKSHTLSLNSYLTSNTKLRFYSVIGSGWSSDIAIDNIIITASGTIADTQAPTAPTGLRSPSKTSNSVNLNWSSSTDNVAVTAYSVYRNGSLIGSTSNTSYTASYLSSNTYYTFYVRARDGAGNYSSDSNTIGVTTNAAADTQSPTAPSNLSSSNTTSSSTVLSWSPSSDNVGISGYRIYRNNSLLATTPNTSYSVNGLTAATNYSFYIKAYDAANNQSSKSNSISVTTSGGSSSSGLWSQGSGNIYTNNNVRVNAISSNAFEVYNGGTKNFVIKNDGTTYAREVVVNLNNFPDYVFKDNYNLLSIKEVQEYIKENGHLPNIPDAKSMETNPLGLAKLNKLYLEKIEELTLYIIELNQRLQDLENSDKK